jgi:autotransporter-associated beta strand protein
VPPIFTNNAAGNWSDVAWLPNPPGKPTGGTQTQIIFFNTAPISSTNDFGSFTLNQLVFANQAVSLSGNPLVFDGANPLVSSASNYPFNIANSITLNQTTAFGVSSNTTAVSGAITGAGGLNKMGAGTLVLSATNSYSGGTTINGGVLQLGDGVRNGVIAGGIVNNSPLVGGMTFNNGTAQTNSAAISGSGSVAKSGSGTLTWALQASYTGPTVINGGTITHASAVNGLGASWSPVSINNNATWAFNGVSANVGTLTLTNGNCGINKNGNVNVSNVVSSGNSTLGVSEVRIGSGTSGINSTSTFNVADGTLTLAINRLYSQNSSTGSVVKLGGGSMVLANTFAGGTPANNYAWNGATILQGGVFQVMQLANGGLISHLGCSSNGATNLVLNGGTLKYAGPAVTIDRLFSLGANGGVLDASGSGALGLANGGAVDFVGSGAHTLTLAGANTGANTLAASLGDSGGATGLVKNGVGAWTLSSASSFSGGTIVSGGILTAGPGATLGTGHLSVSNGAVCVLQNAGALSSGAYVYLDGTLNLAYIGTNTVGRLYIRGVLQPAGLWNAARDGHFAGAGSLNVAAGSATGPIVLRAGSVLSGGGLQLTWTNGAVDLFYTPSLMPPVVWSPVTNQAGFSNGQWSLTLPIGTNGNGFYRLRQ